MVSEEEFEALKQKVEQIVEELNESLRRLVHRVETLETLSNQNNEAHESVTRTLGQILKNSETQQLGIDALFDAASAAREAQSAYAGHLETLYNLVGRQK